MRHVVDHVLDGSCAVDVDRVDTGAPCPTPELVGEQPVPLKEIGQGSTSWCGRG
jgi:hypothetical protein